MSKVRMISNRPTNGHGNYEAFSKICSSCSVKKELYEFDFKQETVDVVIKKELWFLLQICIESDIDLTLSWVNEMRQVTDENDSEDEYESGIEYGKDAIEILNKIVDGKDSYRKTLRGHYIIPIHEHEMHVLCDALDAFKQFMLNTGSVGELTLDSDTQVDDFTKDMDYFINMIIKEVKCIRYDKCMDCSGSKLEDMEFYKSCCYFNCYEE